MTLPIDLTVTADLTLTAAPLHDITNGFNSNFAPLHDITNGFNSNCCTTP